MRIALLVGSGNPSFGGVERHVIHLANGLTSLGHPVLVVMGWPCPIDGAHGLLPGVQQARAPVPDGAGLPAFLASGLSAVRRFRPEVLHGHLTYGLALGLLCRSVIRRPLVYTEHFVVRKSGDHGLRGAFGALLRGRADALIAVSRLVAATCPVRGGSPARHVVYNGTDAVASTGPPGPPTRLLYVGRLEPDKRVDVALEVVRRLQPEGYTLDVVGTGALAQRLQAAAADLAAAGAVRWHGWQADVRPFMRAAGALLQPAREGLGYAALEAAAHGVPLVVPRASGAAEVVAMTGEGITVEEDDRVEAWVAAVRCLARLPAVRRPLPAPFRREQMVEGTLAVYAGLCSAPPQGDLALGRTAGMRRGAPHSEKEGKCPAADGCGRVPRARPQGAAGRRGAGPRRREGPG